MQTTRPTYQQVYGMVMQLSPDDRMRLRREVYKEDTIYENVPDELKQMCADGLEDYKAGRCCTAEEGIKDLEEQFPWLKG